MAAAMVSAPLRNDEQRQAEADEARVSTLAQNGQGDGLALNAMVDQLWDLRRSAFARIIDPRRDIDKECGYPLFVTPIQYLDMFQREGISQRVVTIEPREAWQADPEVVEDEEETEFTPFEQDVKNLVEHFNIWGFLERADELSGIGRFGVVLLGLNDGRTLDQPVKGLNDNGTVTGSPKYDINFMRVFDESVTTVAMFEQDPTNPRFGKPKWYNILFQDLAFLNGTPSASMVINTKVHWTRIIHLADNRMSSEIFGEPRMKSVFNRLYDLRKILAGSAEMFWKGGFPGFSFEVNPDIKGPVVLDQRALKKQFEKYSNGLSRYLALQGVTAKSLAPQVADPTGHVNTALQAIAICKGIPLRVLMGSEQAQLASSQDARAWNVRITYRQKIYVGPMVIKPFFDRLINLGVVRPPAKNALGWQYKVTWPGLFQTSELDKSSVAKNLTAALAQYVAAGCDVLLRPRSFFKEVLEWDDDTIDSVMAELEKAPEANLAPGQEMTTTAPTPLDLMQALAAAKATAAQPQLGQPAPAGKAQPKPGVVPGQPNLPAPNPKMAPQPKAAGKQTPQKR